MRELFVTELVKEVLGPRNGIEEIVEYSPLYEYITGILSPYSTDCIEKPDIDDDAELPFNQSESSEEDVLDSDIEGLVPLMPPLNPKNRPSSMGLSFALQTNEIPKIEFCLTWAKYSNVGKYSWKRIPQWSYGTVILKNNWQHFYINSDGKITDNEVGADLALYCIARPLENERKFLVTVYLLNIISCENPSTEYHIFQPQIRINILNGKLVPKQESYPAGLIEKELAFQYRNKPILARGHLCSAVWSEIDPQRKTNSESIDFDGCTMQSPFFWIDGECISDNSIKDRFILPEIRTDFVPMYSIHAPMLKWNKNYAEEPLLEAAKLAELWEPSKIKQKLGQIHLGYIKWIQEIKEKSLSLSETEKEISRISINRCEIVAKRIEKGINLLIEDCDARLAFCFANEAVNLQYKWKNNDEDLVWYPFQLAYILMVIESIANTNSENKTDCDLLWVPTGGGKTEAYLALTAFTIAYKRRRTLSKNPFGVGTSVISRYTLRLLTIQQFRRALSLITACEYLRVFNLSTDLEKAGWKPLEYETEEKILWGSSRFSIGLWVGSEVTPNKLNDAWGGRPIYGALSILEGKDGKGEPAQVLNCPCCGNTLSIPQKAGLPIGTHKIYWIVHSSSQPDEINKNAKDLVGKKFGSFLINDLKIISQTNSNFYTLFVDFSSKYRVFRHSLQMLWRSISNYLPNLVLESTSAYNPGYFLRWYVTQRNKKRPYDFEIFCTNPNCDLVHSWFELTPKGNLLGIKANLHESKICLDRSSNSNRAGFPVHVQPAFQSESPFKCNKIPIPAYTVDEQVYRRLPSMLIATVDKFARPPYEPKSSAIFGNVDYYHCIWGYYRDFDDGHPQPQGEYNGNHSSIPKIQPPDLVIQDELHLLEGPLGSLVGIYETAIDSLCNFEDNRLKYISSTATIKNADEQVQAIFSRKVTVFPPSALDSDDRFFVKFDANSNALSDEDAGRLYLGICAPGRGPLTPTVRIYSRLLNTAWTQRNHKLIDPYWTLVGYFNAIRELGGARALYWQDIPGRLNDLGGNDPREIPDEKSQELSSRTSSTELPAILDLLKQKYPNAQDTLFTTSMFGTGIDISRFGLMVVQGQPKTTSSYIQSTGRVGRKHGALVVVFLRATRPRDLNHYEFFCGYHRQLQRFVEPVTVAPYSPGVIDRALGPLSVFMLRHARGLTNPWQRADMAPQMASLRTNQDISPLPDIFQKRADLQPLARKPPEGYVSHQMKIKLDSWQQIAARHDDLEYVEYAISKPPVKSVVLGDAQHQHSSNLEVVFNNSPQSLRDVEESTGFQT